ncbi:hypothetical protein FVEN_g12642 [Fusarium venenatum]|uniref:Uncharacterized protein n=1 Tax=Fusarium venenatum TaxID=56646 RepID=A0A2L2TIN6_9HYPO|nr:uncharacterized protein FVRRES_10911 [Fusarium venenatum]KAG8361569.1 hypothetical protein FVEN_g12642 [Fusarium venenatum]CEI70834.1 unnamed protein product [Fusarium venenatum]
MPHPPGRRPLPDEPTPQQPSNNQEPWSDHSQGYALTHNPIPPRRYNLSCAKGLYEELSAGNQMRHGRLMEIADEMHNDVEYVHKWLSLHLRSLVQCYVSDFSLGWH